jgi:hypothetical protein
MPNSNLISRYVGAGSPAQGTNIIPSLSFTTNTEALFTNQAGGVAVIYPQPVGQVLGATTAPSYGSGFDGFAFKVRAVFKLTVTATSTTGIISIYANQVSTTITSGNKVATVTSQSLSGGTTTAYTSGFLEAYCIWDSLGLTLSGLQTGVFGSGSAVSSVALTNTAISIPALTNLNFSLTGNTGTGSKAAQFAITEFAVETV